MFIFVSCRWLFEKKNMLISLESTGNESNLNKSRSAFPGNRPLQPIFAIARVNEEQCPPDSATHAAAASGREKGILSCGNAEVRGANEQKCLKYTDFSWLFSINIIKIYFHIFSASSLNPVTGNFPAGLLPPKEHPLKGKVPKRNLFGCFLARATQEENYNLSPPIRICPCRLAAFQHRLILA